MTSTSAPTQTRGPVNERHRLRLGGVDQWVLIRGADPSLPVVLFLHGANDSGFWYASYLGRRGGLERRFVVAYWDRRGTGRSAGRHVPRESITIEQYAADTLELVDWLRARFGVEKVALFGASVGSLVGAFAAARAPERISTLVSMGQFVNDVEATAIAVRIATERAHERGDAKAIRALEEIGPPPHDFAQSWRFYSVAARVGPYAESPETRPSFAFEMMRTLLRTPGYSLRDKVRALGRSGPLETLVPQLARYDLRLDVPRLDVPLIVLQGRLDHRTPGVLVEDYLRGLVAPAGKRLIWLEKSGHLVAPHELGRFEAAMRDVAESLELGAPADSEHRRSCPPGPTVRIAGR